MKPYEPDQEQIRRESAAIRDAWTLQQRRRRGETVTRWQVPAVRWDDLAAAWVEVEGDERGEP